MTRNLPLLEAIRSNFWATEVHLSGLSVSTYAMYGAILKNRLKNDRTMSLKVWRTKMTILGAFSLGVGIILFCLGFVLERYFIARQPQPVLSAALLTLGFVLISLGDTILLPTFIPDIAIQKLVINKVITASIVSFLISFILFMYIARFFTRWARRNREAR